QKAPFSSSSSVSFSPSSPGAMPAALNPAGAPALQEALENAGRIIDRQVQDDRCYPDLSELLSVPAPSIPSVSGMADMDYPLQGPGLLSIPNLPEISSIRRVPLPPELVEQFGHMQCNCMMGVFPEISRAWLTIDSDIFMWNYEDGGDLAYFDGLSETILTVGLVKPKAGIFQPHIRHLLVLATPVDIVILGLSYATLQAGSGTLNDSMSGGMQLLPDPLYSLPTDNTYLLTVTSTENGRIFLAGKDGCLYEVAYQAEAGWFSQRCRKINHSKSSLSFLVPSLLQFTFSEDDPIVQIAIDNSRNILYTRSEKGVIQVYDLGSDGQGMVRVASVSQNAIVSAAGKIARTIDRSVFKPIIQIAVIENSESIDCQLLAITHAGVRMYFSVCPFKHPFARPSSLMLIHVRLPPGFSAASNVEKPSKVHRALYTKGTLLMAASESEDNYILWCINHDSFPFQKPMMETQMKTPVDGHSWALSEIDVQKTQKIITPLNKDLIPVTDYPVVVQQHMIPPKKFVLLSAQGSFMFHKLRPVDQLRHLFVCNAGSDGEDIERFFKLHPHKAQSPLNHMCFHFAAEAQLAEKASLQGIQQLVRKTCQALALWKLLCEHQFNIVVGELQKANELLQRSRQVQNKSEKENMLRESLRDYQKISTQVDLANVCVQYRQVRFYEGVVELALTAAEKKDPQGLGLHYYKNGEPEEDVTGYQAFQERVNCYKCITDTLQELVNQSKAAPQSPSVPKKPGPPVLSSDPNMLSNEEAGHHFEQMLKLAQRSTDELFSIALYGWLIQADLSDKLLQINSPFMEPYLTRMAKTDQNKVRYMDLLWRFFEKSRSFSNAARVLAKLADMHSTEISLQQRLEYIARAILSAKSSTAISPIAADGEFLHELEEKMEVARIQFQIQEALHHQCSHHSSVQDAISQLDSELMDISKLYGEFADPFKLSECKLAILHCAGHSDPIMVQTLWQEIIEKALSDSVTLSAPDRMQALSLKMVTLGKIYAGTPRYFPLDFLVQYLEQKVCSLNWDVGFVTYTMQEIGVPLPRLLEVYDQLFKARDPFWSKMKKPLHLLECIHVLLSGYVQDPNKVLAFERRRFTNICLDAVSCYLVELQSTSPTLAVQTITGNFKTLQAKLERLH
uniref:Nuclear pore complex protein Nup155 n=1 Tax=Anolis carolinensis TaxID=28377 RepID=H9GTP0_ANOCA